MTHHCFSVIQFRCVLVLFFLVMFLAGCADKEAVLPVSDGVLPVYGECSSDSDCIRGGCSGTLCLPRDAEPIASTCEWLDEYECYRSAECLCVDGRCIWDRSPEFEACIEEKRGSVSVY